MDDLKVLELVNINKSFPGVKALSNVNFSLRKGEVHGLIGENGAGKSTLMKILSGAYVADSGQIFVNDEKIYINNPTDSEKAGISIIYQELNLIQKMTVAENIFLGSYPKVNGHISWKQMKELTIKAFNEFEIDIDPGAEIRTLSIAQQQIVEIIKAVNKESKIVIMDEPTSSLTANETKILFKIINSLKNKKISIIFITHKIEELYEICDQITVLRDGEYIGSRSIKDISREEMIEMMIGRKLERQFPQKTSSLDEQIYLKVEDLSDENNFIKNVSFEAKKGEILGFSGLVGAGRTETMRLLFGADKKSTGHIFINGQEVEINNPKDAIKEGIGFVTENRKEEGLLLETPVSINVGLANLKKLLTKKIAISYKNLIKITKQYIDVLNVKTPSHQQKTIFLSGGNQQKVVLAKWLFSDSKVLILDEPTRGIDVGAKKEIYDLIFDLSSKGITIIMVSSELEEIIGMCDRTLIMRDGAIVGEVQKENFSQSLLTAYAVGVKK